MWRLFPSVLWKASNHILWALKFLSPERFPVPLSDAHAEEPDLGFRTFTIMQELLQYNCSPVCGSPTWQDLGFDLIMIAPLLLSCCSLFFVFGRGSSFFVGFQHPPVDGCSTASSNFGAHAEGDVCTFFYSAVLNQKLELFSHEVMPYSFVTLALLVKNLPAMKETDSIHGLRRLPRGGNGYPLQYSCLGNSMDKGAWWATVHGVAKSWT